MIIGRKSQKSLSTILIGNNILKYKIKSIKSDNGRMGATLWLAMPARKARNFSTKIKKTFPHIQFYFLQHFAILLKISCNYLFRYPLDSFWKLFSKFIEQ